MPQPGDAVRVEMTKWVDRPHWAYAARFLGSDAHGDWIGIPVGTPMARPGASFVTETAQVCLAPPDQGWVATFHAPGYFVHTYVDMTTPPTWDGSVLRCVDLDLDVIRTAEGEVFVDDEDEFDEHRVAFGYPEDVVSSARATCALISSRVIACVSPFDAGTTGPWLAAAGRLPRPR